MAIRTQANRAETLQTVERALAVLEQFSAREPEWGLTEIADQLGVSKSMAHRLLATLTERGFLIQDPRTRRYRLGLRLLSLGAVVGDHLGIRRVALPHLEELARQVGETVFLTIRDGVYGLVAARVELKPSMSWVLGIGERSLLTLGASNKILLAYMPEAEREAILARLPAAQGTERLLLELSKIRAQGWAFSTGEITLHSAAVAVPVLSQDGQVLAGIAIAGPSGRFEPERLPHLVLQAQETALQVARHYRDGEGPAG